MEDREPGTGRPGRALRFLGLTTERGAPRRGVVLTGLGVGALLGFALAVVGDRNLVGLLGLALGIGAFGGLVGAGTERLRTRRPRALDALAVGLAVALLAAAVVVLTVTGGWREDWFLAALGVLLVGMMLAAVVVRRRREAREADGRRETG
jgi:peptidoglycan/LPS O-acetylase OafA/YrhL